MTKKKTEVVPIYVATWRRNEIDGNVYNAGDETSLEGLDDAVIGYLVGSNHYYVKNPAALSEGQIEAIKENGG